VEATTNSHPDVTVITNRFHWGRIESPDYEKFVTNLRGIGCPAKTIRDIVLADVEKLYATRIASVPLNGGFWTSGSKRDAAHKTLLEEQHRLSTEKQALLQRLLGPDYIEDPSEPGDDLLGDAIMRFILGSLPDGVYDRVIIQMQAAEHDSDAINERSGGIMLPQDEADIKSIHERTVSELKRLMTPQQFTEFTERMAMLNLNDGALDRVKLSAGEAHELARMRLRIFGPFDGGGFKGIFNGSDPESPEQQKLFAEGLENLLGPHRYADYQREGDPAFQGAEQIVTQHHLPETTAIKVYEVKQLLASEQMRLLSQAGADPGAFETQWHELQETTRAQVQQLLGKKAYEAYAAGGYDAWLTNRAKP
jgi:hypothetical protein